MRLRIFGFSFDKSKAPPLIGPSQVFTSLEGKNTLNSTKLVRYGVTRVAITRPDERVVEQWWLGVLLTVRDSKRFTKLTQKGGKRVMTSELLTGNDSLAEANVFIANPNTGAGLYAHYHQSAALNSNFAPLLDDEFRLLKDTELTRIKNDRSLKGIARRMQSRQYQGYMWMQNLVFQEDFATLVASLKKVQTARVRFTTLKTSGGLFTGRRWAPEAETVEFKIPVGVIPAEVGETLKGAFDRNEISKASVTGEDEQDRDRTYSIKKNPYIIDDFDYDQYMNDFELDFDDWIGSLKKTKIVKALTAATQRPVIYALLTEI